MASWVLFAFIDILIFLFLTFDCLAEDAFWLLPAFWLFFLLLD